MSSKVAIINMGLRRIGASPITSPTDGSVGAITASPQYDELLLMMLRTHQWNWSTKRLQLAQSANVPNSQFDYQYPIPSDFIRAVVVSSSDLGTTDVVYKMAYDDTDGRVFLTDATQLYLTYVAEITDPAKMPPDFRYALSLAVARDVAVTLTGSRALADEMNTAYDKAWLRAVSMDSIEDWPDQRPSGSWVTSRRGYGHGEFHS